MSIKQNEKTKHRGAMHSYWFAAFTAAPLLLINPWYTLLAFVACGSHILVDRIYSKVKRKVKKIFKIRENTTLSIFPPKPPKERTESTRSIM